MQDQAITIKNQSKIQEEENIITKGIQAIVNEHPNKNMKMPKQTNAQLIVSDTQVNALMNTAAKPQMKVEIGGSDIFEGGENEGSPTTSNGKTLITCSSCGMAPVMPLECK